MFTAAGDGVDTQVLDADPAISDCETEDGCGDGDDEIPILYGETQALDDAVVGDKDGVKGCGETQLLDTCAGESSERTEVLSEGEEPSCEADSGRRGDAQERTEGGDLLNEALEKEEDSVESDISADDEEEDAGSRRRSFTYIRAKAVRSSGLAASRHLASKRLDGDVHSKKDDNSEAGMPDIRCFGVKHLVENRKYPINLDGEIGESNLEHVKEISIWSSENHYNLGNKDNGSSNRRVRKLFDDTYLEKNKSESMDDDTAEQDDMPHLSATDNIAGLSYVTSQEPGHQSQVNALELVDKFLLTNDVGSSQELKNGKSDIYKCAPVSSTKLLGCLAEKNIPRNSIGNSRIFDWDDNLEDEGGGDFFWKRKDSLLEGTSAARKTKSHPPKTRPSVSDRSITEFENENIQVLKCGARNNCNKLAALSHSDSQLLILKSAKNDMHHISQAKAKKSLFLDIDEESNSKALGPNLEMANDEVAYNIGPDTQMAAEAMEALCHRSAVNSDEDRHLTPGISMQKNNGLVRNTSPSKNALHQKRSSADPSDAEGIVTRSKRQRVHGTKEKKGSFSLLSDLSINSRMRRQEHENSNVKTRMGKLKLGAPLAVESSGRHAASESSKNKKEQRRKDKSASKSTDIFLDQQNDHSFMSKGLKFGNHNDDSAPVAHRTRHSRRAKLLEDAESLSKEREPVANRLIDTKKEGGTIVNASSPLETRRGCPNAGPQLDLEAIMCSSGHSGIPNSGTALVESKVSFFEEALVNHPKRKRTARKISSNQFFEENGNKPVVLVCNIEKMDKHTKNGGRNKVYVRSVSDILVKPKQKKSIVSTQMLLENAALSSDSKSAQTRPLQKYPLFKSQPETSKCSSRSGSNQASPVMPVMLCSNDLNDQVVEAELSTHKLGDENSAHAEKNAKPEGLSRQNIQSPKLAYATPFKGKNILSPVCVAEDLQKSFKKPSSTTVVRELLRLEASANPLQKDVHRRKDIASVCVLFSNHLDEDIVKQQKKILTRLGLAVASSISDATHFVTDKFVRTQNMLEAIAVGKPVVTPMWLESCGQTSCFLDERNYILRDTKKEKELGFNMQVSLARACQCPILLGKTVYMTPNVKPSRQVLSSLVKAANGQVIARIGRSMTKQAGLQPDLLIISCVEDYSLCIPLLEKGTQIFSSELLLNGIVIQKLEYDRHQLFLDHVRRTRSSLWLRDKDGDKFLPVKRCK